MFSVSVNRPKSVQPVHREAYCICFQDSLGNLITNFRDPSSSGTLIKQMLPFKLSKVNSITTKGLNKVRSWRRMDGETSFECACSTTYSCGVAFSRKEMIWILKSTKSPSRRKSSPLDAPQRVISCVESALNSMIYGDTWFSNHRRRLNVSLSLSQLLPMDSGYLSKLQGRINSYNLRIAALDRLRGMIIFKMMKIPIQI